MAGFSETGIYGLSSFFAVSGIPGFRQGFRKHGGHILIGRRLAYERWIFWKSLRLLPQARSRSRAPRLGRRGWILALAAKIR